MILPNETSIEQLVKMLTKCRLTCNHFMEENLDIEIPIELKQLGGYQDEVQDQFGETYKVCDVSSGKTADGVEMFFYLFSLGFKQSRVVPKLTNEGFQKRKIPKKVYAEILTNRKRLLNSGKTWELEYCCVGLQNCNVIYQSVEAEECHEVSAENYWFLPLDQSTKNSVFRELLPLAEKWVGNKFPLVGYNIDGMEPVYGLRKYTRGAYLAGLLNQD